MAHRSQAYLSEDRKYRYWLLRVWDESLPLMATIGINPSTADETVNDHTIRKDIGFATRLGFGGILKLNVGAGRNTDPRKWRNMADPFGSENTAEHLKKYADAFCARTVVATWGKNGNYVPSRCDAIVEAFTCLMCFGKNPDGTPRHTLTLPYSTQLEKYRG